MKPDEFLQKFNELEKRMGTNFFRDIRSFFKAKNINKEDVEKIITIVKARNEIVSGIKKDISVEVVNAINSLKI